MKREDKSPNSQRTTPGRLIRIMIVVVLFFGGLYFLIRDYAGLAPLLAVIVVLLLLALPLGGIAYRSISHRRLRAKARQTDGLRGVIENAVNLPEEADRISVLKDVHPRELYRAGVELPDDGQQKLKAILRGMDVDLSAVRVARKESGKWRQVENVEMLGWFASPRAIPLLSRLLGNPDNDVRLAAAEALAKIDHPYAYAALWAALDSSSLPAARVATFLESSSYSGRMGRLRERVKSGSQRVRFWTAYLLGRAGDSQGLTSLLLLARDESLDVRTNAAEALQHFIHHPAAREATLDLMDDSEWPVRSHACKAVPEDGEEFGSKLVRLLHDRNWWVRQNAAMALERMERNAVPFLLPALDSEDGFARNKAAEVLTRLGVVADYIELISRPGAEGDPAVEVLLKIARAGGVGGLAEDLEEAPPDAQMRFLSAIEARSDPLFRPLLQVLADRRAGEVAEAANKLLLSTSAP